MSVCVSAVFQFLLLLTLSRGEKKCELATFFCGCLLGWLLSKAAVSKRMNCVGEKLAKQPCLPAVKQRLTKPEYAWMSTVCTGDFIIIRKPLAAQSINQAIDLSLGNAAVLVPAVIINLTRRGEGGIGNGGFEGIILSLSLT
jgi:hypothetical protein